MTDSALVLEETRKILARMPRPLKKKRGRAFTPDPVMTRSLREAGVEEKDIVTLIEGHRHERAFVAGAEGAARFRSELPPAVDAALVRLQEQVGTMDPGQLTMPETADANAEALADVLTRVRSRELGESPRPSLATSKLVEAVRAREVGRTATVPTSREDLHAKMRGKLVRP
jgi:hypothetical protein